MNEVYGVINIMTAPCSENPKMLSLNLYSSFEKAIERSEEIIKDFIENYGGEYIEHATKENPMAIMSNDEVDGYVYIVETSIV